MRYSLLFAPMMLIAASHAAAQSAGSIQFPAGFAPGQAPCVAQTDGSCTAVSSSNPLPSGGKQENFPLVAANTPSVQQQVYGGDYVLSQNCTAYGTLSLQVLAPDGATFQSLLNKTSADSSGGTGISLGSNAVVRATVTGTTGCNATLSRVP